ncbi:hypothetical protein [Pseudoclavibacter sp. Z016]|uniref:hypothetical protein n=1 Tax=Pseudoclavibacter sp. Z016 TaxID=2080581 RepID=UPI000CE929E6|nr:hypothetical protein [Pseudoclavibacter sp. Z016]PPF74911.1 hypothetical protein C5B99_12235 [Pseudoclavibacter sp. Z016]
MIDPRPSFEGNLLTPELPITRRAARQARRRVRRRQRGGTALTAAGIMLAATGIALAVFPTLAPEAADRAYGQARIAANEVTAHVAASGSPTGEQLPELRLGVLGPESLMDVCDGTFPQLEQYATDPALQPMYAAHNGCGGDVILPLDLGDAVTVAAADGSSSQYEVTDLRDVAKHGSTTNDAHGMTGAIVLQTCHWGEPLMRLTALTASPATGPAER